MEQLNNVLPILEGEIQPVAVNSQKSNHNSPLLNKVRQKFGIFGGISLIFGIAFAFCFYKAGIGLNALTFALILVFLLCVIMNKLQIPMKKATIAYYLGTVLLGLSTMLTSSEILQLLNTIGMLLLLALSIIHQFYEDSQWDFIKRLGRLFGLIFKCIAAIGMPFVDSFRFLKKTRLLKSDRSRNIVIGVVISLPILWVIIALLSSADLLFGEMTKQINKFLFSPNIINVGFMVLFGFIACYCIICGAAGRAVESENHIARKQADPAIAVTVMTLLCLVYVLFCSIQVVYLFANGLFVLPEQYTFAQYARRGFFELLSVTIINIILMLISTTMFLESKILRVILTVTTACTYIMIISATYRMLLYIGVYQLTFLRLFVLLFLFIDAFVLAGVITSVYHKKFPLFGYTVAVVCVCYLVFSLSKPDYFIASYLIEQKAELNAEDIIYITRDLSLDAAPVVLPFLSEKDKWSEITKEEQEYQGQYFTLDSLESNALGYYNKVNMEAKERGVRDFNYSIKIATRYAKQYPMK